LAKAMSNQTKATYSLGAMCEKGLSFWVSSTWAL
jgi:hypothetical protein